ncbi:MAG: peptidoglycan-associated lipoprotein Pal [Chromatiales bacterium]|jgi:peptidoglycan-associated lipoprotein
MNSLKLAAALPLLALLLAGCPSQPVKTTPEGADGGPGSEAGQTTDGSEGIPLGAEGGALSADPLSDPGSPLAQRVIYFDFDSYTVRDEYLDLLAAHGQFLASNPQQQLRLEGHTDERGTREYNIGLGERRAGAVEQVLLLQGVSRDQIEKVSYGEELPVSLGQDEESWSLNRRVELNYTTR